LTSTLYYLLNPIPQHLIVGASTARSVGSEKRLSVSTCDTQTQPNQGNSVHVQDFERITNSVVSNKYKLIRRYQYWVNYSGSTN